MQAQQGTNVGQNMEQTILEGVYRHLDQRLGHPAADAEICNEMKITLDKFHRMLERIEGINLGSFQNTPRKGDKIYDRPIRYIPDESRADSSYVLPRSQVQWILTEGIEALPDMERLVISLHYYEELTLEEIGSVLKIDEASISKLHTKAILRLRSRLRG